MSIRTRNPFTSVQAAGVLLPIDLLAQVADASSTIPGIDPEHYHLDSGDRLSDAAARAWNVCSSAWNRFQTEFAQLPLSDRATTLTRDRFLLPLFRELGFGRLQTQNAIQIDDKSYPISHAWGNHVPIHLVSARLDLDRRQPGSTGPNVRSPYSLVQELLNRSAQHRWGILSNGLKLYLLRDNNSLTRASNVEFDLKSIFENESISDFKLLFNLLHQSRFEIAPDGRPEDCWLEKWSKLAGERGTRAREKLRNGVEQAINALGSGFLDTRGNATLKTALRSGQLDKQDFYRQLLRMVYRLLLLLVAENRKSESGQNLLHPIDTPDSIRNRYARFYSVDRLRTLAQIRKGTTHTDLYESLKLLFEKLRSGHPSLGIPGLGSFLFSDHSTPDLDAAQLTNEALLNAFRHLTITTDDAPRGRQRVQAGNKRAVDFANLGSDELGSVYESLLELHPEIETDRGSFHLSTASGNERKTSGSYYTPTSLIHCLLDSALDPVVHQALDKPTTAEAEKALLALKICDPACGSGHFLIAASERLGKHLARLRTGDDEPSLIAIQHAKREVIGNCIYGVDLNPMSAELCKVSLWMEALEPGKPLSFLDHHIQVGNSLLGTTPALMAQGIPDGAFEPIEGDDKKVCTEYKKLNKLQRCGQEDMFDIFAGHPWKRQGNLAASMHNLDSMPSDTPEQVEAKAKAYQEAIASGPYQSNRLLADAWCAAFVWKKAKNNHPEGFLEPITQKIFETLAENSKKVSYEICQEIRNIATQYKFFHWHIAFPDVFQLQSELVPPRMSHVGWSGGFDVVIGNPPWERIKLQEKEWFAKKRPDIATASNLTTRQSLLKELARIDPQLFAEFRSATRQAEGESLFVRASNRFPLCGRGDVNVYAVFAEVMQACVRSTGRVGCVIPSGIVTDDSTKLFFQDLIDSSALVSVFDFENRERTLFPDVYYRMRFSLITFGSSTIPSCESPEFIFLAQKIEDLKDETRKFSLTKSLIAFLNPNTRTCPIFRNKSDMQLCLRIRLTSTPWKLIRGENVESPWSIAIRRIVDTNTQAKLLIVSDDLDLEITSEESGVFQINGDSVLRLYEGKMIDTLDHRYADSYTVESTQRSGRSTELKSGILSDPTRLAKSRFYVLESSILERLPNWQKKWFLSYMDVCSVTNARTVIPAVIPWSAPSFSLRVIAETDAEGYQVACLATNLASFVFDYYTRQFASGLHLSDYIMYQMPVLPPGIYSSVCYWDPFLKDLSSWLLARLLELSFTACDLQSFSNDCGWHGPPFRWDEERRFQIRCELDAAFFHLYLPADEQGRWKPARVTEGAVRDEIDKEFAALIPDFPTPRDAVAYIMETFPIVKRRDIETHASYRTKDKILEVYDKIQSAIVTGSPYKSPLNPPPGPPTDELGHFLRYTQINPADYPHIHPTQYCVQNGAKNEA